MGEPVRLSVGKFLPDLGSSRQGRLPITIGIKNPHSVRNKGSFVPNILVIVHLMGIV
jgi:hypothetical protein